ncbi:hypothetical protein N657DRAFT_265825 [Parathielavia appendiculata]|uniref:Secreted protein n=1 Tax=Parathielavia appendiculata TaxID=2587402 RepID=A0AAN6Z4L4_9PEZI|nr:hypothetical protein N657DRAFT_265825 [Parathielavia appendiculata]
MSNTFKFLLVLSLEMLLPPVDRASDGIRGFGSSHLTSDTSLLQQIFAELFQGIQHRFVFALQRRPHVFDEHGLGIQGSSVTDEMLDFPPGEGDTLQRLPGWLDG